MSWRDPNLLARSFPALNQNTPAYGLFTENAILAVVIVRAVRAPNASAMVGLDALFEAQKLSIVSFNPSPRGSSCGRRLLFWSTT